MERPKINVSNTSKCKEKFKDYTNKMLDYYK